MDTLIIAFRFLAVSQVLLFLISMGLSSNPSRVKCAGSSLILGILAYLIAPVALSNLGLPYAAMFWTVAALVPSLIILFIWVVFEERKTIPTWLTALLVGDIALEVIAHITFVQSDGQTGLMTQMIIFKRLLLVLFSIYLLWRGKECDLVEARSKLRWCVIASIAALTFFIDLSHIITSYVVPPFIELPSLAAVFLLSLTINLSFLRHNPRLILVGDRSAIKEHSDDNKIQQLLELMVKERLYADHDLRIGTLAKRLGLPEYQLRKKINQSLGYRNFNHFVNHYRIEEAGSRLKTDERSPVLSVAIDVGFRSISSFNSAFQNHFGLSPTAFRKQSNLEL